MNFRREVTPGDVNLAIEFLSTSPTQNCAADMGHAGRFTVPVVSAHGSGDATVCVEGSDTLRQRMAAAGNGQRLVQNFVDSAGHSYRGDAYYPPLFNALLNWVEKGQKPTPAGIATSCLQQAGAHAAQADLRQPFNDRARGQQVVNAGHDQQAGLGVGIELGPDDFGFRVHV